MRDHLARWYLLLSESKSSSKCCRRNAMYIIIKSSFTLAMVEPPFGLCKTIFGYISNSLKSRLMESNWNRADTFANQNRADIFANQRHICKPKTTRSFRGVIVLVALFIRGRRTHPFRISTANSKCKETFESIKLQENLSQYH